VFLGTVEARAYYFGGGHTNDASAVEWVKVLDEVLKLDFDVVIPGHGALLTKERVRTDVSTVAFKGGSRATTKR